MENAANFPATKLDDKQYHDRFGKKMVRPDRLSNNVSCFISRVGRGEAEWRGRDSSACVQLAACSTALSFDTLPPSLPPVPSLMLARCPPPAPPLQRHAGGRSGRASSSAHSPLLPRSKLLNCRKPIHPSTIM